MLGKRLYNLQKVSALHLQVHLPSEDLRSKTTYITGDPGLWKASSREEFCRAVSPGYLLTTWERDGKCSTLLSQAYEGHPRSGVPSLQDLMPDDLRWSWYNNRNKVHNKCNMLESSWSHSPHASLWKNCLPQNWYPMPKRLGTTALENIRNKLRVSARKARWTFHSLQEAGYGGKETYRVIFMQSPG